MILHSIMISFSWYSAFFLMDDHSRELSVEHGDLSRDRKFKEVNRWLPLETLWLKAGHLNCDGNDIPRKSEHLEIGLYILRCFKWGEDPNVIAATFEDGLYAQVFRKADNLKFDLMPTHTLPWIPHQSWSKPLHQGCAWGSSSIKRISTVGEGGWKFSMKWKRHFFIFHFL